MYSKFRPFILIIIWSALAGLFFFTNDAGAGIAVRWLITSFILAVGLRGVLPITNLRLWDDGFGISFGASLAVNFFITWIVCAVCGLKFNTVSCVVITVLLLAAGILFCVFRKDFYCYNSDSFSRLLRGFIVYTAVFLVFFWCIGFAPEINPGTEKYMDYGFMTTMFRQENARPLDLWFSGEKLNYYYLGQAASVYMTRICFTNCEYGYNLMLCTFIATVFTACGEISEGFTAFVTKKAQGASSVIAGLVGGFLAAFAANFHWVIYGILIPFGKILTGKLSEAGSYWFSDSTVFIRTAIGDYDNGKNEFPAYSVVLGDLHAHVVDLIFTLPFVAIMLDMIFSKEKESRKIKIYRYVLLGFLLALYKGTNYWDFVIFYVLCGGIIAFSTFGGDGFKKKSVTEFALAALVVTLSSVVFALPFTLSFEKMASSICICQTHTKLWKFIVLWGFPLILTLGVIILLMSKSGVKIIEDKKPRMGYLAFLLCTVGLIITPEVIYIQDIYGGENARFNTMFKLTYVAFVLFAIIIGITAGLLYENNYRLLLSAVIVITVLLCMYVPCARNIWEHRIYHPQRRRGISAVSEQYTDPVYSFEMKVVDYLSGDNKKDLRIVEAAGNSYSHESSVSVYSGAQTVAGWFVHEWLWRGNSAGIQNRSDEVALFYQSGDKTYCRDFLKKYDVDYIVVGPAELSKYYVEPAGFEEYGEAVLKENVEGIRLDLIKVDRSLL